MLVEEGKYRLFRRIDGDFNKQAENLILLALKERPSKIVIDENGVGKGLVDSLTKAMDNCGLQLKSDGTVIYK